MMIEDEHLQALSLENEQIIAEAEATGSRSTAAAYHTQQLVLQRFRTLPAAPLEGAAYGEAITIQGFAFRNCEVPGCDLMTDHAPCPVHGGQA